jgi:hypothetical protein
MRTKKTLNKKRPRKTRVRRTVRRTVRRRKTMRRKMLRGGSGYAPINVDQLPKLYADYPTLNYYKFNEERDYIPLGTYIPNENVLVFSKGVQPKNISLATETLEKFQLMREKRELEEALEKRK